MLGQHLGTRATLSPAGFTEERLAGLSEAQLALERENDRLNRDVFEEQVDLVLDAWTKESLRRIGRIGGSCRIRSMRASSGGWRR